MGIYINAALSGINVSALRMQASAENVARAQVQGAERQRVEQNALAQQQGVSGKIRTLEPSKEFQATEFKPNEIDLAKELTDTAITKTSFEANARMFDTGNDMVGRLLNIKV